MVVQSSFLLGILHGVMPCGHSWLILAPFVAGEKDGKKVSLLTFLFLLGMTFACVLVGLSLGSLSEIIPHALGHVVDIVTAIIVIGLGLILLVKPEIIHKHGHNCNHDHNHNHNKECNKDSMKKIAGGSLFVIGFVNMIIPCPTVAIMYTYALKSESYLKSIIIFLVYAFATSIAVSIVIFGIYKTVNFVRNLNKDGVELIITRCAGGITIVFGFIFLFWG